MTIKKTKTTPVKKAGPVLEEQNDRLFLNGLDANDMSHIHFTISEVNTDTTYLGCTLGLSDGYASHASFDVSVYHSSDNPDEAEEEYYQQIRKLQVFKETVDDFVKRAEEALKAFEIVRKMRKE